MKAYCFPTDAMIAELLGCSERTVTYSLKRLEACGYITRHMNRTKTGWYRTIVITARVPKPKLAIIEPPAQGGPATDCGTPLHPVAGPLPQRAAEESSSEAGKKEKRNSGTATSPKEGGSPSPKGKAGNPEPESRPIEEMTAAEVDSWREMSATPGHPFRTYARKMVEIYERHQASLRENEPFRLVGVEKPGPGTPDKVPQDPASRVDKV
jgi:hypothetical protein